MGVATATSRLIGFARILVIAAVLGTTYLGNAYQSSNAVSNVLFELLAAGALSAVLVPTFVTHLDRGNEDEAERLAGRILGCRPARARGGDGGRDHRRALDRGRPHDRRRQRAHRRAAAASCRRSCCASSSRRSSCTRSARSRSRSCTPSGSWPSRRWLRSGSRSWSWPRWSPSGSSRGPTPGLDLSTGEQLILALGGTLGVVAFVGIPTVGALAHRLPSAPAARGATTRSSVVCCACRGGPCSSTR